MSTAIFGIKLRASLEGNNTINTIHLERKLFPKNKRCTVSAKHTYPVRQGFRFCGQNVNLLRKHLVSTTGSKLRCFRESQQPLSRCISYLTLLWKEGLFLLRASVFTVVIFGTWLLVWFGRNKAKGFVETKLLPSVCSVISDYIQRDIHIGKVQRISPLSVTLESCSLGPHKEEFSWGEAPTVKIRLHPLVSLRRRKLVVDVVLSHPTVLIVQKKDYSWLGLLSSEGGIQRHLSSEEGIDYRTRTRRLAREEAAVRQTRERDAAAREAAEMGYFVSEGNCGPIEGDDSKETVSQSIGATNSKSFFCMNEGRHDHHCVDTGVDYDVKHADLEKSFEVKFPSLGLKFWSRFLKGHRKHKFKRKAKRNDICASGIAVKRRILEHSALAARAYFHDQSRGKFGESSSSSGYNNSMDQDGRLVKTEVDEISESVASGDDNRTDDNKKQTDFKNLEICFDSTKENVDCHSEYLKSVNDLTSQTRESKHENLESSEDVAKHANANSITEKNEELGTHEAHVATDVNSTGAQRGLVPEDLVSFKPGPQLATYFHIPFKALIVKLGLTSLFRNVVDLTSHFLSDPIEKLKLDIGLKDEDIVAEHAQGAAVFQSEGLTKILPVTLDSVHFRGATVMLLTYGDREAREMENVNGHVKLHNHYSHINVQLSGNCKSWRSDDISEDGGRLSVNIFVDTIKRKWHANLKIDNLFVPLFERILEIPITWSEGRASGEVLL